MRYLAPWILVAFPAFGADCEGLTKLALPDTNIQSAQNVAAGTLTVGGRDWTNLPAFCRVIGTIKPTSDSDIRFEVWLPASGWNGKFQGIGNGGFAGAISHGGLADAIRGGYAAASTDTGHQGGGTDASWALKHPEKIVDFGHRAIHEMTVKGKAITTAYMGSAPKRSYFNSCSNGGRQALMEAQRYPEDYDGIIAGAPANAWVKLLTQAASNLQATTGEAYIPQTKLPAVQAAVMASCDAADGLKDGLVDNPGKCRFDPASLLCRGAESEKCLTAPQVKALKKLYDGTRTGKGELIFPGYSPSGEAEQGGWGPWITGRTQDTSLLFEFGTGFFRNMLFNDSAWDFRSFNLDRDYKLAEQKMGPILNSTDPNLKPFHARGGKLILYHGWCDAAIPAQNAIDYYQSVLKTVGAKTAESFVRLYMVPGMQHCGGGSAPNAFGQGGVAQGDARTNISAALERWVEQGTPPAEIIAVESVKGQMKRSRPLCPFPAHAVYKGTGSVDDAASFTCADSQRRSLAR